MTPNITVKPVCCTHPNQKVSSRTVECMTRVKDHESSHYYIIQKIKVYSMFSTGKQNYIFVNLSGDAMAFQPGSVLFQAILKPINKNLEASLFVMDNTTKGH